MKFGVIRFAKPAEFIATFPALHVIAPYFVHQTANKNVTLIKENS